MVLMMKKNIKMGLVAGLLLLVSFPLFSQQNILRYADQEFALKRYENAASQYEQAFDQRESYHAA
jgi:hypothetical protein